MPAKGYLGGGAKGGQGSKKPQEPSNVNVTGSDPGKGVEVAKISKIKGKTHPNG